VLPGLAPLKVSQSMFFSNLSVFYIFPYFTTIKAPIAGFENWEESSQNKIDTNGYDVCIFILSNIFGLTKGTLFLICCLI